MLERVAEQQEVVVVAQLAQVQIAEIADARDSIVDVQFAPHHVGVRLASCGGDGVCRKCKVELVQGELNSQNTTSLTQAEISKGTRLACISSIVSDVTIRIPEIVRADGTSLKSKPKTTKTIFTAAMLVALHKLLKNAECNLLPYLNS